MAHYEQNRAGRCRDDTFLFLCLPSAPPGRLSRAPVRAADNSALPFVTAIYDAYKGKHAKGIPLENGRIIRRYFEPQLATLMAEDQAAAAKRGEVGLLDYDPFLDAQDWDKTDFEISVDDAGAVPRKRRRLVLSSSIKERP